ncbi:MAG: murein biosynthesis integral membrane protein MurJ [Planctomycetota bacterium]
MAHDSTAVAPDGERRTDLGRAIIISVATLTSRFLGVFREHLFAKLFGVGPVADAFQIAYRIPNLLRELVAEGALSFAFVPVFTEYREKRSEAEAHHLAQIVFTGLFIVVGGVSVLGFVFTGPIVDLISPGFAERGVVDGVDKRQLTIELTRWMIPFLLLAAWAALCRGILNTYRRFFLPALSPALFNLVAVGVGVGLWWSGSAPIDAVYGWAIAMLCGGALQFLIQVPAVRALGVSLRWRIDLKNAGFRRILWLMTPAVIGLAAVQLNIFINTRLASDASFGDGPVTMMTYAYRLVYLPIGVIGVALATVTAVRISRDAAREELERFREGLSTAVRFLLFFTIPSTVGLVVLAEPIVRLVFGYGRFAEDAQANSETAIALGLYASALFFYCGVKVLVPAFYALDRIRVPLFASLTAIAVNLAWSLSTVDSLGWHTLVFGTALAGLFNFAVLAVSFHRTVGRLDYREIAITALKVAIAVVPMAYTAWGAHGWAESQWGSATFWSRIAGTLGPIFVAIGVYFLVARILGLREAIDTFALRRRRR